MPHSDFGSDQDWFKQLFDISPDPTWIIDGNRFVECNDAAIATLGYSSREEFLNVHPSKLSPPRQSDGEDSYTKAERMMAIARDQGLHRFEWVHTRANSQDFVAEVTLSAFDSQDRQLIYCVWRDITERKQMLQTLAENESRLRTLVQTIPDLVWLKDEEGIYLGCNPMFERFFGAREADIIGRTDYDFIDKELADFFREHDRKAMAAGKPSTNEEWLTFAADGYRGLFETIKTPMVDAQGNLIGVLGIARDITKRKLAEIELHKSHDALQAAHRELQATQSQLLQSEKMASIGQLAAGVAHEINNPIGYVYSNLGALQKYLEDVFAVVEQYEKVDVLLVQHPDTLATISAAKQRVDLDFLKEDSAALMRECNEGITRVRMIVQDLKDFSHVGAEDEWVRADLRKGMDSTLNIVWNELKYKCEVIKDYGEIPDIQCLPAQLNQVFMNLLVNASHAIEEKGTITIRTGTQGDNVWVEIADTGKGIAPEHLTRIFEPFFTTKPIGKGTGLGLSLAYSIIQKHHGSIEVESAVGKGTTFRMLLPVEQPDVTSEGLGNNESVA